MLVQEEVDVPEHLRHLPELSPPLQRSRDGLLMGSLLLPKNGGEVREVSWFHCGCHNDGSSPRLLRRSWITVCLGVKVDGVCAVGCNRQKVLAAVDAVKASLDAAGLQCSEDEADASRQVFSGLQLNHETGLLSLEASRTWRLRLSLEFCRAPKISHRQSSCQVNRGLVGSVQAIFQSMPFDRTAFENVPSILLQPKSARNIMFGGVWRKPREILLGGKASVMGLRHACRSSDSLGERILFLLDNMALVLGASKGRDTAPNFDHTCREICIISLVAFTVPVCRWIASEGNPADEPSRSKRHRADMLNDVDQCGTSARGQPLEAICRPLCRNSTSGQ